MLWGAIGERRARGPTLIGPNGIPTELYQACATEWAPLLCKQFNACFDAGAPLSPLQRRGRIAQLFKSGVRADCANHRPVCALNRDYQVCSACLNARFVDAAALITGHDQTGFVADRYMEWNIRKFLDGLHYAREHGIPAAAILFDFRKAYDNVSHAFLFAVIDIMCGVPLDLVWEDLQSAQAAPPGEYTYKHSAPPTQWLQTLYRNHMRTVSVNGTTTEWFLLESSVPQGDVLAPTAFILYIEALGILLRTNPEIHGIVLPSGAELISVRFADDTGIIVTPPSIAPAMTDVEVFSAASGMVNHNVKTVGEWIGALWQLTTAWEEAVFAGESTTAAGRAPRLTWLPTGAVMKLLGVMMGYDVDPTTEWKKVASSMLTTVRMWAVVPLSIRARVSLVKSLMWSRAWFLANYRRMPDRLRDLMWGVTVYYVVRGRVPQGFTFDGAGVPAPRVGIGRGVLSRPLHWGGVDLWSPADHMVAQNVKPVRGVLTPVHLHTEMTPIAGRTQPVWNELAQFYVQRLNWVGMVTRRRNARQGESSHQCTVTAGRGLAVLIEGCDITAQMRRHRTLHMPDEWVSILRDYGTLHSLATALHPETMEECLAMPLFGSPWVQLAGAQLHLSGRWAEWPAHGVQLISDVWHCGERRWRTAAECTAGLSPSPIDAGGLVLVRQAVPPVWHELLCGGRCEPTAGEWLVTRQSAALHQGALIEDTTTLCSVIDTCWLAEDGCVGLWVEQYRYDDLQRGFALCDGAALVRWREDDWRNARAEFSEGTGRTGEVYYGATHDVFSWMPRRVQWRDMRSGALVCDLETFTIASGRRLLAPGSNTMAPAAMALHRQLSTAVNPSLPQALGHIWQHNTWTPATREYAWRVATGVAHVGASAVGWTGVEQWECVCTMCAIASTDTDDSALLDSVEHRLKDCVMAKHAWAWASAVLVGAGIAYPGEAAGFWLYGGTLDIHSERVVSVLRGAFFEAIRPARQQMAAQGAACPETVMADMMRERVAAEARLDVFYVSEAFERSYDAREKKAGRPETVAAVRAEWRGYVRAARASNEMVVVLPRV